MNDHEVRARTRKAALLAEVVWQAMRKLGVTIEEVSGAPLNSDTGFWLQAAREAKVNPPSAETVLMVLEMLEVRAQVEAAHAADPFVGL